MKLCLNCAVTKGTSMMSITGTSSLKMIGSAIMCNICPGFLNFQ